MEEKGDEEILKAIDGALGDDHSLDKRVKELQDNQNNYVVKQDFLKTVKNLKHAVRNKTKPVVNLEPLKKRISFLANQIPAPYNDTGIREGLQELREKVDTPPIQLSHDSLINVLPDQHHADLHTISSHDTTATGLQLNTLTDGSNADGLHTHDLKKEIVHLKGGGTVWTKHLLTVGGRAKNTGDKTIYIKGANDIPADTALNFTNPDASFVVNMTVDGLIEGSGGLTDGTVTLSSGAFNIFPLTPSSAPSNNYDMANKKYVDDQVGGVNEFTEMTDTPASYTGQSLKGVRVNSGESALEFYTTVVDTDEKVGVDSGATAGYLGAASSDGVLRTGSNLSYADGGDFVTLDVDSTKASNWDDAYGKRVDTWGDGLAYTTQTASVDYNTTNLKITASQLDTIQGIGTGASPSFTGLTIGSLAGILEGTAGVVGVNSELTDWLDDVTLSNGGAVDLGSGSLTTTGDILIDSDSSLLKLGDEPTDYTIGWDGSDAVHTITAGDFAFMGGDFGIGTATPISKLHIVGAATGADTIFHVENTAQNLFLGFFQGLAPNMRDGQGFAYTWGKAASARNRAYAEYIHAGDGSTSNRIDFGFFAAPTLLTILAGGNIGMGGVTDPDDKLEVTGNIHLTTDSDRLNLGAAKDAYLEFDSDSLNIVANAITGANPLELTAGSYEFKVPANTDIALTFTGTTKSGLLTWMEGEDRFDFADAVLVTGFHTAITTKTNTDYTATINDDVILVSTGATTRTISFPAASTLTGKIYHIKKIDSGAGNVTLDPDGAETVDGDVTPDITAQYESFMIVSDGSNWNVI